MALDIFRFAPGLGRQRLGNHTATRFDFCRSVLIFHNNFSHLNFLTTY